MTNFLDNPSYHHWHISNYKFVLENCSFQYCLLTDVNIAHSDVNIDALFTLSKQHDCFADHSLDLTLIVSFWKIALLVCCWKQIIISRSWHWTQLPFSTHCSNGCVLCNFQWFLFSIMRITILLLYIGGGGTFFGTHYISVLMFLFCSDF